jgi:small subunit ribosomal protein S6e
MEGERKRKMIRAHEITLEFVQVNARVTAYGDKPLDEIFPKVERAEGEEKKGKVKKVRK